MISALDPASAWLLLLLLFLGSVCEWLEVRLGAVGSVSLRPTAAFVALWQLGPGAYWAVGIVTIVVVQLALRRRTLERVLVQIGREAVALAAGFLGVSFTHWALRGSTVVGGEMGLIPALVGMGSYWAAWLLTQVGRLSLVEGMRASVATVTLARAVWPHVGIMTIAALALGYAWDAFGFVVATLAAIALIEAYYPWKLLGDQDGVLLTSLQMMAQAVDLKDPYTSNHSQRVSAYAVRLARALGLPEDDVERIRIGALMHDLGKIGISGGVIRKPGALTVEEQALMRQHAPVGADIIEPLEILGESARMVRHHHEHWDGSGYPDGLEREQIPLGARVILVADAFDALVTDRPYRKGVARAAAVQVIRRHAGTQFDPAVVSVLERVFSSL